MMTTWRNSVFVAFVTLVASLATGTTAAHASDNSNSSTGMTGSSAETVHEVVITGFKFVPETLTVKAGDVVNWTNEDIAPHTATADDKSFDTGEIKMGESGSIIVTRDMTLSYYCLFHPSMKAKLILK